MMEKDLGNIGNFLGSDLKDKSEHRRIAIECASRAYNSSCPSSVAGVWIIEVAKHIERYLNET
jgi:hypothetical protein